MLEFLKQKYFNREFFERNHWRIICSVIAIVLGILLISVGFFKTLLLVIITALGYIIGKSKDRGIDLFEYIVSLFK